MRHLLLIFLANALVVLANLVSPQLAQSQATFTIINLDGPGEGFNDPTAAAPVGGNSGTTIGQQRLNAFQHAADIWGDLITSPVVIRVDAQFDPLTCTANSATLGSAGPKTVHRDFAGAPVTNTWYVVALANSLFGGDLNGATNDINATFSSTIGTPGCLETSGWYYGLDANPPSGKIDFVTVLLHELGHGLGFLTSVSLSTGQKLLGFDDAYMRHLEDHTTGKSYPQMTDSERVAASINTGNLHQIGPNVVAGSGGLTSGRHPSGHVQMFSPNPAQSGSSVSHFDTALFPNELMEPIYTGPLHDVGLTLELFADIGWDVSVAPPLPTFTLTVASSNPNSGVAITVTPNDNNGQGNGTTQFTRTYNDGTHVTLIAPSTTTGGNEFNNWTGCDSSLGTTCNVTMSADKTVTAAYVTPTRTLTVASSNPNSGVSITVSPNDNNSQGNGTTQFTRTYNNNTSVTLTAPSTAGGNNFSSWSGCDSSSGTTCNVSMSTDATVTATFVAPLPLITLSALSLANAEVGVNYSAPLVTGGLPPYNFTLKKGAFPSGLGANAANGNLAGVPTSPSRKGKSFTVQISDQLGSSVTGSFKMKILKVLGITTTALKAGTDGKSYSKALKATGGLKPYIWSLVFGSLPTGLSLDPATGKITGIPTDIGPFNPTFQVTDPLGGVVQKSFTLTINP